jgi:hypothetical protein
MRSYLTINRVKTIAELTGLTIDILQQLQSNDTTNR